MSMLCFQNSDLKGMLCDYRYYNVVFSNNSNPGCQYFGFLVYFCISLVVSV